MLQRQAENICAVDMIRAGTSVFKPLGNVVF